MQSGSVQYQGGTADYGSQRAPRAGAEEHRLARWGLKSGRGPYPPRPGPAPHLWEW